jgi:glucosamine-phosphate N-acetyltransferase
MNEEYIVKDIEVNDYYDGYLELMYEFTNYKKNIDINFFTNYIKNRNNVRIIVLKTGNNKIIGAGTIFNIEKLHNNSIGQIEDVIITEKYRNNGLGKIIINKLIEIGKNEFNCYKIILNCLDKNIEFYKKCDFNVVGVEMKLYQCTS